MAQQKRPDNITLPPNPGTVSPGSLPSPRMQRLAGEVTPAMSPLDMFAAQSRALARQLDESRRSDRRVSRLPPLAVADGLGRRHGLHSASPSSAGSHSTGGGFSAGGSGALSAGPPSAPFSPPSEESGIRLEIESPQLRPKSQYPRFSKISSPDGEIPRSNTASVAGFTDAGDAFLTPGEYPTSSTTYETGDYFGAPRSRSPEQSRQSMESASHQYYASSQQSSFSAKAKTSLESSRRHPLELARGLSVESSSSHASHRSSSLQPPNPPYARKTPSIRSVDTSDEDNPGITPSSSYSQHRKLSSSSGTSLPLSPQLQFAHTPTHQRSASQLSEFSQSAVWAGGNRLSRPPAFNFSRPLSRASVTRPSMDSPPSRMSSLDSHTRIYGDEDLPTPMSLDAAATMDMPADSESVYSKDDGQGGQSSYIYAKYSLPRGRMVDRDSLPLEALMPKIDFDSKAEEFQQQQKQKREQDEQQRQKQQQHHQQQQRSVDPYVNAPLSPPPPIGLSADTPGRSSTESLPVGRGALTPLMGTSGGPAGRELRDQHRHSMTSMDTSHTGNSGSTIKASKHNRGGGGSGSDLTAEQHLQKGIECHERGSLNESTYHLRLAARQNNPTAMLLFALACRHGWGMRQNPQEGIHWLRKAIDCANIEMSESGATMPSATSEQHREKRAQFALGVYELGVSHMNGWGVEHDKVLALRCFEIASAWGDADAMAEAGFCYYQGVGCKKDLRKAAKYYRQAEAKGMSMVGNSWIHKSKYDEKPDDDERSGRSRNAGGKGGKKRDKSRTRSLFSRKRSDK